MKYFFIIPAATILFLTSSAQTPPGIEDSINNIKGRWVKTDLKTLSNTTSVSSKELPSVLKEMEILYALANKLYPEPKGMEIRFHRYIGREPLVKNGPAPFSAWTQIFLYYYNTNLNKILLEIESGEGFEITVNSFPGDRLFSEQKDLVINGKKVYSLPKSFSTSDGMKTYVTGMLVNNPNRLNIIISKEDKPLLIPVLQRDFLPWLRNDLEKRKQEALKGLSIKKYPTAAEDEATKQKTLANIEKNYPPQKKEAAKAGYLRNFVSGEQRKQQDFEKTNTYYDDYMKRIDQYLADSTHNNIYRPALTTDYYEFDNPKSRLVNASGLVFLNPDYFDLKKPRHLPQFFVVSWYFSGTGPRYQAFKKHFEEDFDFDTLKKTLPGNKSP
jgi:hypothetical protein